MNLLSTHYGNYTLQRLSIKKDDSLRAWDAADELLLNHIDEQGLLPSTNRKVLLINDQFGALSISLNQYSVQNWSDSYQSHCAVQHNLKLNQLADHISYVPCTESPNPEGSFDLVLIKIPKTMALLEDELIRLRAHITTGTTIIAAGMTKHIHTSTLKLFEKVIGTTKTSLATKKARLIFTTLEKTETQSSPYPTSFYDQTWDIQLSNHANVFGKDKLDIGARFMLEQLKQIPTSKHIIDLGCGNGVLGIIAQRQQPDSQLTFVDESYMAVASAKANYQTTFGHQQAKFIVSDALLNYNANDTDLILCNPPFHQQHAISDHIAREMFKQSHQHLQKGGELWVVGNRHLGYHIKMKHLFGNCRNIAGNKKFVVLASTKN